MDDKGSTMICIWGLSPYAHLNDAERAILTSFNLVKALSNIKDTYCNIGISSGECFQGIVGTSGTRKELSVLGDVVNLAARIMGSCKSMGLKNAIKCDLNTRMLVGNKLEFVYLGHSEMKGKSISIPIFKPLDPLIRLEMASQQILQPATFLQTHQNPMHLDRNTNILEKKQTIGLENIIREVVGDITDYFTDKDALNCPFVSVIRGNIGTGKSELMRQLIDEFHKIPAFEPYLERHNNLPVFTSTINPESQLHFLSSWRPIFQMLLQHFCKVRHRRREQFIAECIIKSGNQNKTDLICKIMGIEKRYMRSKHQRLLACEQVQPLQLENEFVKMPDYDQETKKELIEFLTLVFKCMVGEDDEISDWGSIDSEGNKIETQSQEELKVDSPSSDRKNGLVKAPIIVCIDEAQQMCPTSWLLLEMINNEVTQLAIFLLIRKDYMDRMMIDQNSILAFEAAWDQITRDQNVWIYEMPQLSAHQVGEIILASAPKYKTTHTAEILDMTNILDPENTLKDPEKGEETRLSLMNKWQLNHLITEINPKILQLISKKCRSNPVLSLQYFVNMLHSGFCEVRENGSVTTTEKFDKCDEINNWTSLPTPRLAKKIVLRSISTFMQSYFKKKVLKPGELDRITTTVVLLKVATVIGNSFMVEALKYIQPIQKYVTHHNWVEESIQILEQNEFLEIVDMQCLKKKVCRFTKPLFRESVYQMLKYHTCKKDLHQATNKYFQMHPSTLDNLSPLVKTQWLLSHMLLSQNCTEERDMMRQERTALVVLRIQNCLKQSPNCLILRELLRKPSNQGALKDLKKKLTTTKFKNTYVTLSQYHLKWHHSEFDMMTDNYRGCAKLQDILEVTKLNLKGGRPSFRMKVFKYDSKNKKEEAGKRNLTFSCDTVFTRDKWIAAIDYLKTRGIYDQYIKNNQLVNFTGCDKPEESVTQQEVVNKGALLHNFGDNMKKTSKSVENTNKRQSFTSLNSKQFNNSRSTLISAQGIGSVQGVRRQRYSLRTQTLFNEMQSEKTPAAQQAQSLAQKIKLLYNTSMTSFLHHIDSRKFEKETELDFCHTRHQKQDRIEFPNLEQWKVKKCIQRTMREASEDRVKSDEASCHSSLMIQNKRRESLRNFRSLKTLKESTNDENIIRRSVTFNPEAKSQKINQLLTTGNEGGEQKLQMVQKTVPMHSSTPKNVNSYPNLMFAEDQAIEVEESKSLRRLTENIKINKEPVIKVIAERQEEEDDISESEEFSSSTSRDGSFKGYQTRQRGRTYDKQRSNSVSYQKANLVTLPILKDVRSSNHVYPSTVKDMSEYQQSAMQRQESFDNQIQQIPLEIDSNDEGQEEEVKAYPSSPNYNSSTKSPQEVRATQATPPQNQMGSTETENAIISLLQQQQAKMEQIQNQQREFQMNIDAKLKNLTSNSFQRALRRLVGTSATNSQQQINFSRLSNIDQNDMLQRENLNNGLGACDNVRMESPKSDNNESPIVTRMANHVLSESDQEEQKNIPLIIIQPPQERSMESTEDINQEILMIEALDNQSQDNNDSGTDAQISRVALNSKIDVSEIMLSNIGDRLNCTSPQHNVEMEIDDLDSQINNVKSSYRKKKNPLMRGSARQIGEKYRQKYMTNMDTEQQQKSQRSPSTKPKKNAAKKSLSQLLEGDQNKQL